MSTPKTRATVLRGFSRFYILKILKEKGPMTGKEIMTEAETTSQGVWKPSPGLVYPLLGRLMTHGLIDETKTGKYRITKEGERTLEHYAKIREEISRRFDVMMTLASAGKILAEDVLDRITTLGLNLRADIEKLSTEKRKDVIRKYKSFLESELRRITSE